MLTQLAPPLTTNEQLSIAASTNDLFTGNSQSLITVGLDNKCAVMHDSGYVKDRTLQPRQ